MTNTLILVGAFLAITGSFLSIGGTLLNNLWHLHRKAMFLWMISNPMLLLWAVGYLAGWWDGGISVSFLAVMYGIFTLTNWYGLKKYNEKGE